MKTTKLTARDKYYASASNPEYDGLSKEEIKRIRTKARGHFWHDDEFENFVSFSKTGKMACFEYKWHC